MLGGVDKLQPLYILIIAIHKTNEVLLLVHLHAAYFFLSRILDMKMVALAKARLHSLYIKEKTK